jgi:hypothetical protein
LFLIKRLESNAIYVKVYWSFHQQWVVGNIGRRQRNSEATICYVGSRSVVVVEMLRRIYYERTSIIISLV